MPKAVISGGTGFVGRFVVEELLSEGYDVTVLGRTSHAANYFSSPVRFVQAELGLNFDYQPVLEGADCFIHGALDHLPGRFVGGQGDDAKAFAFKNLGGTVALFKQAKKAGIARTVFLSSQEVYGAQEEGIDLYESDDPKPDNLYGKVKYEAEKVLEQMNTPNFTTFSLRLANVYGPAGNGRTHKWQPLFKAYLTGKPIKPFAASEIHGEDAARAVSALLRADSIRVSGGIFNAADFIVDRRDILGPLKSATGCVHDLPEAANRNAVSIMNCDKMKRLEWRTGGTVKLSMTLGRMIQPYSDVA